jgi:hypothetical protein
MNYLGKLEALEKDFETIEAKMADPATHGNLKELQARTRGGQIP